MDFYFFLLLLVLLVVIVGLSTYFDKLRREKLILAARQRGWILHEQLPNALATELPDGVLFPAYARSRKVLLVFEILRVNGSEFIIEYRYSTGSGKSRQTHRFLACCLPLSSPIPKFMLRSENWVDKLTQLVGFDDIDLPENPEFSKRCHLSGEDKEGIKAFFTRDLVARVPELKNRSIVSLGSRIFVREHRRKLVADKLQQAHDEMVAFGLIFN